MNEFGTQADALDARDAAIEQAREEARLAILRVVHGKAARDAAALLAEGFGFVVSEPTVDLEQVADELGVDLREAQA